MPATHNSGAIWSDLNLNSIWSIQWSADAPLERLNGITSADESVARVAVGAGLGADTIRVISATKFVSSGMSEREGLFSRALGGGSGAAMVQGARALGYVTFSLGPCRGPGNTHGGV